MPEVFTSDAFLEMLGIAVRAKHCRRWRSERTRQCPATLAAVGAPLAVRWASFHRAGCVPSPASLDPSRPPGPRADLGSLQHLRDIDVGRGGGGGRPGDSLPARERRAADRRCAAPGMATLPDPRFRRTDGFASAIPIEVPDPINVTVTGGEERPAPAVPARRPRRGKLVDVRQRSWARKPRIRSRSAEGPDLVAPAGIARDPVTGQIFILDAARAVLVVLDGGNLLSLRGDSASSGARCDPRPARSGARSGVEHFWPALALRGRRSTRWTRTETSAPCARSPRARCLRAPGRDLCRELGLDRRARAQPPLPGHTERSTPGRLASANGPSSSRCNRSRV